MSATAVNTKKRDRPAELVAAKANRIGKVTEMVAARRDGTLGEDVIKIAQAMILCTLPYGKTQEREITREARLGDGSTLKVTFQATKHSRGVPLPFGADRHLLAWLFDRAIRSDSPDIPWESATEYRREMGLSIGGSGHKQLAERFTRLSGLLVQVSRESDADSGTAENNFMIVERSYLPKSITGKTLDPEGQESLPGLNGRFGFTLSQGLWRDIRKHHRVLPRQIWRDLAGSSQLQDLVYWLLIRCHEAKSPSLIPWSTLLDQFPHDSNTRRFKANAREAVSYICSIWPTARLKHNEKGIAVDYCPEPLLPDDTSKGRYRLLKG